MAVAAGEIDAWHPEPSPATVLPVPLCGAILSCEATIKAVQVGEESALAVLIRNASWATASELSPPASPAARSAAPAVTLQWPEADKLPVLRQPPRPGLPTLLVLVHNWGGGTIRYAATLGARLADRINVLYGWGVEELLFQLSSIAPDAPEAEYDLGEGLDRLVKALRRLGVVRVDVMHSIGFDNHLEDFLDRLGVPFDVTLLDYHQVASGPHLINEHGRFVGDAALVRLDHPARRPGPARVLLRAAQRRIACSRDLAARAERLAPGLGVIAARLPEPGDPRRFAIQAPPLAPGEELRVLHLGRIAAHKGQDLLSQVAALLSDRGAPISIYCLGGNAAFPPAEIQVRSRMRLLGGYDQDELNLLICRLRPHLAWLPFTAPETHSFSLSDAMLQGLPILVTGLGAIPERLEGRPATWCSSRKKRQLRYLPSGSSACGAIGSPHRHAGCQRFICRRSRSSSTSATTFVR